MKDSQHSQAKTKVVVVLRGFVCVKTTVMIINWMALKCKFLRVRVLKWGCRETASFAVEYKMGWFDVILKLNSDGHWVDLDLITVNYCICQMKL